MAKIAVIHLSDIHIETPDDEVLKRSSEIAATCFDAARNADACVIALTGDIAFSGMKEQFAAAKNKLIETLVARLGRETGREVFVAAAPGNHDCTLRPVSAAREALIDRLSQDPALAADQEVIDICTKVQGNFFEFLDEVANPKPVKYSKLFWQQHIDIAGRKFVLSTLNAAWMSRIPEAQGQMAFPIDEYMKYLQLQDCTHVSLVHHPLNWYAQTAYQGLRRGLRSSCSAVLSGHEHLGNIGQIKEQVSGTSLFFESQALHPHEKDAEAGFAVHTFDLDARSVTSQAYTMDNINISRKGDALTSDLSISTEGASGLTLTPEFSAFMSDAGGNFTHAAKEHLSLDELFVWPDVKDWDQDDISKRQARSSQTLLSLLQNEARLIIYGDEKSGKTTLLLRYHKELLASGFVPVFLSATDFNIKTADEVAKKIGTIVGKQYLAPDAFGAVAKERRILLIDDIDRLKSGMHSAAHLLTYAEKNFSAVCVTAASGFEITNLTSKESATALNAFTSFDLMRFGQKLRHKLIKRWCEVSPPQSQVELDRRIHEIEGIINSVIGKRLVPEHPIYLLILLQSSEQHRYGEIQNSGLSFYYQYLITKSLGGAGVKANELDEHFNYLSILAWAFKSASAKELDIGDLAIINRDFSDRFVTVDLGERLKLLTRARVLARRGDCYSFAYPYVYYFFMGRYLARNIDNPDIRSWVQESCRKLHLRERAHAIMFLTHHSENVWVIEQISQALRECFIDKQPIELDGDTRFLDELVERTAQMSLPAPDVERNQSEARELSDEMEERQENSEVDDSRGNELSTVAKWNLLHKTAEILGLVLKNHYGSLERAKKQELIGEVFNAPLRALRLVLEDMASDLPRIVQDLQKAEMQSDSKASAKDAEKRAKRRIFHFFGLIATSVVASSASYIGADKLREDVARVVKDRPTNSYRLILAATRLLKPGSVPLDEIRRFAEHLEKNPYAFGVLQTLGFFHMYMFHTDEPQKQALSSMLKIDFQVAKGIELQKQGRTAR